MLPYPKFAFIEQDHRPVKKVMNLSLGFKSFQGARSTITGVELIRMLKKNQLSLFENNQSTYQQFCSLVA